MTKEWHGLSREGRDWFSDEALRKQDEFDRLKGKGEKVPIELFHGMFEPRVPPTADECCACCGLDAREQVCGELFGGARWCAICVGREHHIK